MVINKYNNILYYKCLDKNPSEMKLYTNKTTLSLSDLDSCTAIESFALEGKFGKTFALKVAKFRNTATLHVSITKIFNDSLVKINFI